jgi:hypothetical protein
MASKPNKFPRRRNKDGSYDSICLRCFATVARSKVNEEIPQGEQVHVCDSSFLAERGHFTRPETLSVLP